MEVHPGVVLVKPDAWHPYWRVRYRDDITGRVVKPSLTPHESATAATRLAFAVELSEKLARDRRDRELGKALPVNVTVREAVTRWMRGGGEWSIQTRKLYRRATDNFIAYVGAERWCRELTPDQLVDWRAVAKEQISTARGIKERRGRDLVTVNHELRMVKTFLRWARVGAGCALSRDEIAEALKPFKVPRERIQFFDQRAVYRLIKLARQLEAPAYPAIRFLLLTGMRLGEYQRLDWKWITEGDRICVPASVTKTAFYRDVDLTITAHALPPRPEGVVRGPVFPTITPHNLRCAFERLRKTDPTLDGLSAHALRRTCSTFFTNAFDPWRSAKSLGHTVVIAEKLYAGLVRVPEGCTTLEQAMGIAELLAEQGIKPLRNARAVRKDIGIKRIKTA